MSFNFQVPAVTTDPLTVLERKPEVRTATPGQYVKERLAMAAENLSHAGEVAARVEIVNEALFRLVYLVFEADTDGGPCNVDAVTWRLLVPLPWGESGWRQWKLRKWEGRVLRSILLHRQASYRPGKQAPLFTYDEDTRTWRLNYPDYPSVELATRWLKANEIGVKEWKKYATAYREHALTLRRQYPR